MRVQTLMTPSPLTLRSNDSIGDALGLMLRHDINEVPIVDDGALVGIVTRRDLQVHLGPGSISLDADTIDGDGSDTELAEVMTRDLETLDVHASAGDAARALVALRVGSMPVVDARGRLVGILSVTDLLAAAADLFDRAG